MMAALIKFLKGIAIGVANIIPGFSSGTMALMLNAYDDFVSAFADIAIHPLRVIKRSGVMFLGMGVGIVGGLFFIAGLLEIALFPTILFFIGLILGTMPNSYKKASFKPFKPSYFLTILITVIVVVGMPLLNESSLGSVDFNFWFLLTIVLMGALSASAMVIPGVSGSMILMMFGYYTYIITSIKDGVKYVVDFNFFPVLKILLMLLFFLVGVVIGVILVSKLVRRLYTNHTNLFHVLVVALLASSPIAMLIASNREYNGTLFVAPWWMYLIGVVTLILGTLVSYYGDKISRSLLKEDNKNEVSEVSE